MTDEINRRRVLQLTAVSVGSSLAGCTGTDSGTPTAEQTPESTPNPAIELSVTDTESDDGTITIRSVGIDKSGWLVIHPEAPAGGPNGVVTLAERSLSEGSYTDVSLTLDTITQGDQTVYAMLHYDNPADGTFTFPNNGDPPVTNGGSPVIEKFTVTGTGTYAPSLSVQDQETDGRSLVVPQMTIDDSGWLVVHPEADGGGPNGSVTLAQKQVDAGTYRSVTLSPSETLQEDQTLYAMLHYDDPADGTFTFPDDGDPAVTSDGSSVVKSFSVTVTDGSTDESTSESTEESTGERTADGTIKTVEIANTSFSPMRLSVEPGTTVEWTNTDGYGHDVQSSQFHDTAESWDYYSEEFGQGETAQYTFQNEGIYEYYCTIHGQSTMCGAVLVGDVTLDQDLPCE
jgi:plastocyanin